ncbi:DNA-binding transcriptional regulator, LysR family [Terrimicrobium sacchariphilum]|uniref:DNA-binding transcriptional regulator, LysR family n=1 Tax=Terrimicrobium sacchariphilum TaxID=690879 RepID=A0A146G6G1_TERSA|nr:LysR substrate-binding domain-containing protein [Terrimicrobium sacchariphilum]GAT32527.1 DNA-binding transcriptional regulator, LysR family [Terrimicrobium sacchariphilum]
MELRHLRYFVSVAEELSFLGAARRMNVSQPPLSQAIKELEEELGARLFNRTSRKVELTDAGLFLLSRARSILAQISRTGVELQLLQQKKEVLRIGFVRPISILPPSMKAFRSKFPDVHLTLVPSSNRNSRDFLTNDEADANIGAYLPPDAQIDSVLWAEMTLQAIVPDSHPLAGRAEVTMKDLADYPLLLPGLSNPTHMGREILQFCRQSRFFDPATTVHCDDLDVLLAMVESEAGIGIVHGLHLNRAPGEHSPKKPGPWVPILISGKTPPLQVGVMWRKDRVSPALSGLLEELESRLGEVVRAWDAQPGLSPFRRAISWHPIRARQRRTRHSRGGSDVRETG